MFVFIDGIYLVCERLSIESEEHLRQDENIDADLYWDNMLVASCFDGDLWKKLGVSSKGVSVDRKSHNNWLTREDADMDMAPYSERGVMISVVLRLISLGHDQRRQKLYDLEEDTEKNLKVIDINKPYENFNNQLIIHPTERHCRSRREA